jgi:hypothetical protein
VEEGEAEKGAESPSVAPPGRAYEAEGDPDIAAPALESDALSSPLAAENEAPSRAIRARSQVMRARRSAIDSRSIRGSAAVAVARSSSYESACADAAAAASARRIDAV